MADLRDEIVKRLAVTAEITPGCEWGDLADAVLAVVEAHTRAAQAQALRDAALLWKDHDQLRRISGVGTPRVTPEEVHDWLRARADELDPRPEEEL